MDWVITQIPVSQSIPKTTLADNELILYALISVPFRWIYECGYASSFYVLGRDAAQQIFWCLIKSYSRIILGHSVQLICVGELFETKLFFGTWIYEQFLLNYKNSSSPDDTKRVAISLKIQYI